MPKETEEKKDSVLDAVNAAIEPTLPQSDDPPVEDADAEEEAETLEVEGQPEEKADEKQPDEKQPGDKKDSEQTPDEKAAAEAAAKKSEKPEGEQTPEEKAAAEAAAAAAKKKSDPKPLDALNDPIPPGASERTKERITSLVTMVKDKDTALEKAVGERDELIQQVASTGVTPENFANTLTILALFNSPRREDKKQAFDALLSQVKALANEIGEVLPGSDPLDGHADLAAEVQAQKLTKERAAEIARSRNQQKAAATLNERTAAEERTYQAARTQAVGDLNELGQTLAVTDPAFAQKAPLVTEKLKPIFARLHPSQWYQRYVKEYREFKLPAAAAKLPAAPAAPAQQPLRANKQPSGQGKKQPTSALEAMEAALGGLGR